MNKDNLDCFAPIPSEQPNVFKEECPSLWNYLCECRNSMDQKPLGTVTGTEVTESGAKIFVKLTEEGLDYINELLRKDGEIPMPPDDITIEELIEKEMSDMKMTRFEEVKKMSVEELAKFIDMAAKHDDWCKIPPLKDCPHKSCQECIVDWLNEKVQ